MDCTKAYLRMLRTGYADRSTNFNQVLYVRPRYTCNCRSELETVSSVQRITKWNRQQLNKQCPIQCRFTVSYSTNITFNPPPPQTDSATENAPRN